VHSPSKEWSEEVKFAHYWIKTFGHHAAVIGKDYQSLDNFRGTAMLDEAERHLSILRQAGLLVERANRWGDFIVLDL